MRKKHTPSAPLDQKISWEVEYHYKHQQISIMRTRQPIVEEAWDEDEYEYEQVQPQPLRQQQV